MSLQKNKLGLINRIRKALLKKANSGIRVIFSKVVFNSKRLPKAENLSKILTNKYPNNDVENME